MRRRIILLATVGLVYGSQSVFNVHDDLLAFPQYEVVFSDAVISDIDAESRLAYAASSSSARAKSTSETPIPDQETAAELAHRDGSSSPHSDSQDPNSADATNTYESMILNDKRYLCTIPRMQSPPQNETSQPPTKADDEQELARASDRGWELLKDMEGHCMYFISGWWSYSFCYNAQIKQFHQLPPSKGTPPYPPSKTPPPLPTSSANSPTPNPTISAPPTPPPAKPPSPPPPPPSVPPAAPPSKPKAPAATSSKSSPAAQPATSPAFPAAWRSSSTATRSRPTASAGSKKSPPAPTSW
ncbi:MAG: misfolded glyco proteins degradation protein Yos9 [Lasallia pustulata]|uniref:Endoplasmic reticulum lectin n=1 Tax=Lasallia pustulata TaxID=136370 RepID=A0A5M8PL37_9LECA|nr:MAG: misfolded glyco proteins degradation protein Yos9 [Lasallia pustulata]